MKRLSLALLSLLVYGSIDRAHGEVPIVAVPEIQPFAAHVRRLQDALTLAGAMLTSVQSDNLVSALKESNSELAATKVQAVLDSRVLFFVDINGEMRVKVSAGNAKAELLEGGWRTFLVKVRNDSGTTAELKVASPQAERLHNAPADTVRDRWLGLEMVKSRPLQPNLGGLPLEYRLIQLYSRDAGPREAKVSFNVGQGTQDLGFRNEVDILFQCQIAREVRLSIIDENGKPTLGSLSIRDSLGHVFPAPAKRLAPDFSFHPQIYRADGETLRLPEGRYQMEFQRGPESIPERQEVSVGRISFADALG